ncbi:MAG: Lrp/AsnC family transcriptional regulator [Rhodospirillaceae bacterium]|nr:Lrp/AsnC family transcriptional regulator [Rhodospirillaceae bacterium]
MDAKDRQIIRALQISGRLTNQELSEKVNLSPSPCSRRVRALEESGVITGYTALVNQKAYGLPLTVFVRIRLEHHSKEAVARFEQGIQRIDEILDCFLMTGVADYLLRVIVANLDAYEGFVRTRLHTIPGIASIDTSFAYGTVKQTQVYPAA